MDFRFVTADEREKLYNEVWTEPVTTVAQRYDISDNGLRKHCKRLGIPLPQVKKIKFQSGMVKNDVGD